MLKRSYLWIAAALIFMLVLSACGRDTSRQAAEESGELGTRSVEASALAEHEEVSLRGNQASPAGIQETFNTVQVVKLLTPSVVQIVTEFLAMDMLNHHGGLGIDLNGTVQGAHHPLTDRGATRQPQGMADGDNLLAHFQARGKPQHGRLESRRLNTNHCRIGDGISPNDLRREAFAVTQGHSDALCPIDDVINPGNSGGPPLCWSAEAHRYYRD